MSYVNTDNHHKIMEFEQAVVKFNQNPWYSKFNLIVSTLIIILQILTFLNVFYIEKISLLEVMLAVIFAYIVTDFINGLVHMYMDNNTAYDSFFGPFIAVFHFHHFKPRYIDQHPLKIYFYESGFKFWLVMYLLILFALQHTTHIEPAINLFLVSFGILSSFAELSHYWCHNSNNQNYFISFLQKYHVLLNKKHHIHHHRFDNTHYAFLNGITDPLLNKIALRFYKNGYKNQADIHVAAYFSFLQQKNNT